MRAIVLTCYRTYDGGEIRTGCWGGDEEGILEKCRKMGGKFLEKCQKDMFCQMIMFFR